MGAQMSTAMIAAPSRASRNAWLRPCPRAAPVISATFPSSGAPGALMLDCLLSPGAGLEQPHLMRLDLQCEELAVEAGHREVPAHEPQAVLSGASPHALQLALVVQPPDRPAPVRDLVAEQAPGGLAHAQIAGGEDDDVGVH